MKSSVVKASAAALAAATGATAWWAHRELRQFQLHRVHLDLLEPGSLPTGLRSNGGFRILHISDLHMIPGQQAKITWVSALDELQPDLVVNTGDNLSDLAAVPAAIAALGPLLDRPGVFVFGTNDYWAPRPVNPFGYLLGRKRRPSTVDLPWRDLRAAMIERGWQDATHRRLEFKASGVRLAVAGVDDPHHDLDDYDLVAGPPHPDCDLSLAVVHAPEPRVLQRFADDGYDLALSGHTHGGQVCLPFKVAGSRTIVTNCGIDRARAAGLSAFGPMALHVSNGLGTSKFAPFRLFCRPSATLLTIGERRTS